MPFRDFPRPERLVKAPQGHESLQGQGRVRATQTDCGAWPRVHVIHCLALRKKIRPSRFHPDGLHEIEIHWFRFSLTVDEPRLGCVLG